MMINSRTFSLIFLQRNDARFGPVNSIQRGGRTETSHPGRDALECTRMRELRLGVLALFAFLLVLAGGAAYAAKPRQAVFKVTLTAALTKTWTFTRIESSEADCTRTT